MCNWISIRKTLQFICRQRYISWNHHTLPGQLPWDLQASWSAGEMAGQAPVPTCRWEQVLTHVRWNGTWHSVDPAIPLLVIRYNPNRNVWCVHQPACVRMVTAASWLVPRVCTLPKGPSGVTRSRLGKWITRWMWCRIKNESTATILHDYGCIL